MKSSYPLSLTLALVVATFSATSSAETKVDVLDPEVLSLLDQPGLFSLATLLGAGDQEAAFLKERSADPALTRLKHLRLKNLKQGNEKFQTLVTTVEADIAEIKEKAGEKMAYSAEEAEKLFPGGNGARHFDPFWLSSSRAALPLIGVINRVDRKDFSGRCGELRFIYRLSYYRYAKNERGEVTESRSTLPFFLNAVYDYEPVNGSCQAIAESWITDRQRNPQETKEWLLQGPLARARFTFRQLEMNLQAVRFPSGQKGDFGGQAMYLFRIFQEEAGKFTAAPLENTPDLAALASDPALKADLVNQISAGTKALDQGTFVLKNTNGKMLARKALSFSTTGRARLANKPYTLLFGADGKELRDIPLQDLKFLRSTNGLVERLNNQTCMGCHQSSGTAGFHLLGRSGALNSSFNKVILPFSPHYYAEQLRRRTYIEALARSAEPDTFRQPSFFPPVAGTSNGVPTFHKAQVRDLCLPGAADFSPFSCGEGSVCKLSVKNKALGVNVGECVAKPNSTPGHACREGVVTANAPIDLAKGDFYNVRSMRDTIDSTKVYAEGLGCTQPVQGVPLGRMSKKCEANSADGRLEFVDALATGKKPPKAFCAMQGGPQFDECAKSKDPPDCLAKAEIKRAYLDTCYVGYFCREDYICQQLPPEVSRVYRGAEKERVAARVKKLGELGIGFCVPNYFIFNMRADGHLIPEGRQP